MSNVTPPQATQQASKAGEELKQAGKESLNSIKTIRNVAAGVAVASLAAMGAEALGVVTIPAMIPTGTVALVSGGVAGVFGLMGLIGDGVDSLMKDVNGPREAAIKAAGH